MGAPISSNPFSKGRGVKRGEFSLSEALFPAFPWLQEENHVARRSVIATTARISKERLRLRMFTNKPLFSSWEKSQTLDVILFAVIYQL